MLNDEHNLHSHSLKAREKEFEPCERALRENQCLSHEKDGRMEFDQSRTDGLSFDGKIREITYEAHL